VNTSFYVLRTLSGFACYLPWAEGERLAALYDANTPDDAGYAVTDLSGSVIRGRIAEIDVLFTSTPESRQLDAEMQRAGDREARANRPRDWES
jgi:hypothetical protein